MQESPLLLSTSESLFFDFHTSSKEISDPHIHVVMEPDPYFQEDDMEFTFASNGRSISSPVPADKIFLNGQIRPTHPFKLPGEGDKGSGANSRERCKVREPLKRLFSQEREWNSSWNSCSSMESRSYEGDELDSVAPRTYCLWRPQEGNGASKNSKKNRSNESGKLSFSKRWEVKDLFCNHGSRRVGDEPME